jgi:hypothetical protein
VGVLGAGEFLLSISIGGILSFSSEADDAESMAMPFSQRKPAESFLARMPPEAADASYFDGDVA